MNEVFSAASALEPKYARKQQQDAREFLELILGAPEAVAPIAEMRKMLANFKAGGSGASQARIDALEEIINVREGMEAASGLDFSSSMPHEQLMGIGFLMREAIKKGRDTFADVPGVVPEMETLSQKAARSCTCIHFAPVWSCT